MKKYKYFIGGLLAVFMAFFMLGQTNVSAAPVTESSTLPNLSLVAAAGSCNDVGILGWVICPAQDLVTHLINLLMGEIGNSMEWSFSEKLEALWTNFLPIANVAFAVVFMIVIYSTATGAGLTNYSVKKILPRLIVVAIAINVSYYICAAMADLSNIIGANIEHVFPSTSDYNVESIIGNLLGGGLNIVAIVVLIICCSGAVALALLTIFIALTARYVVLFILVAIAPLAIVCALLPQTEKYFKKWMKTYVQMLTTYPIFMFAWHGIRWIQSEQLLYNGTGSNLSVVGYIISLLLPIAPLFVIIPAMKFGGGLMSKLTGGIQQGIQKSPLGSWQRDWDKSHQNQLKTGIHALSQRPDLRLPTIGDAENARDQRVLDMAKRAGLVGQNETNAAVARAAINQLNDPGLNAEIGKIDQAHEKDMSVRGAELRANAATNEQNQDAIERRDRANRRRRGVARILTGESGKARLARTTAELEAGTKARDADVNRELFERNNPQYDNNGNLIPETRRGRAGRGIANVWQGGAGAEAAKLGAEAAEKRYQNSVDEQKLSARESATGHAGRLYGAQTRLNTYSRQADTLQEALKSDQEDQKALDNRNLERLRLTQNRSKQSQDIQKAKTLLSDEADLRATEVITSGAPHNMTAEQVANAQAKEAQNVTSQTVAAAEKEVEAATNRVNLVQGSASHEATRILNHATRDAESSGETIKAEAREQAELDGGYVEEMRESGNRIEGANARIKTVQTTANEADVTRGSGTGHTAAQAKTNSETAGKSYEAAVDKALVEGGTLYSEGQAYRKAADIATQAADNKQKAVFNERVTRGIRTITDRNGRQRRVQDPTVEGSIGAMERAAQGKNTAENKAKGIGKGILAQDAAGFHGKDAKDAAIEAAAMETYAARAETSLKNAQDKFRTTEGNQAYDEQQKLTDTQAIRTQRDEDLKAQAADRRVATGAYEDIRQSTERRETAEGREKQLTSDSTRKALDGQLGATSAVRTRNQRNAEVAAKQKELTSDAEKRATGRANQFTKQARIRKPEGQLRTRAEAAKKTVVDADGNPKEVINTDDEDVQIDQKAAEDLGLTLDQYYEKNASDNAIAETEAAREGISVDEYYKQNAAENAENELLQSQEALETQDAETEMADARLASQAKERESSVDKIREAKRTTNDEKTRQATLQRKAGVREAERIARAGSAPNTPEAQETMRRMRYSGLGDEYSGLAPAFQQLDSEIATQVKNLEISAERQPEIKERLFDPDEIRRHAEAGDEAFGMASAYFGAAHGDMGKSLETIDLLQETINNPNVPQATRDRLSTALKNGIFGNSTLAAEFPLKNYAIALEMGYTGTFKEYLAASQSEERGSIKVPKLKSDGTPEVGDDGKPVMLSIDPAFYGTKTQKVVDLDSDTIKAMSEPVMGADGVTPVKGDDGKTVYKPVMPFSAVATYRWAQTLASAGDKSRDALERYLESLDHADPPQMIEIDDEEVELTREVAVAQIAKELQASQLPTLRGSVFDDMISKDLIPQSVLENAIRSPQVRADLGDKRLGQITARLEKLKNSPVGGAPGPENLWG